MLIDQILEAIPNLTEEQIDRARVSVSATIGFGDERVLAENIVGSAASEALEDSDLDPSMKSVAYFAALGLLARDEIPGDYFSALIADWSAIVGPFDLPLDLPADLEPLEAAGEEDMGPVPDSSEIGITPVQDASKRTDEKRIPKGKEPS